MTTDEVDRLMLRCEVCGCAWDEHGDEKKSPCIRYKPKYVTMMERLRDENARLLIELEVALEVAQGEMRDMMENWTERQ